MPAELKLFDWVRAQLPPPPARLLEVGCGEGELARALAEVGHDVLAVDPVAPDGAIFRRTTIEALDDPGPFDAVVESRALHHVGDLDAVVEKLARLTPLIVLDEFAWDRLDEPTARWYEEQRRAGGDVPPIAEWKRRHGDLHGFDTMRAAFARRFAERHFSWTPYLFRYLHRPELAAVESALIRSGAIRALGFRYVGVSTRD
jgi:SAM-dependent methyltransferase